MITRCTCGEERAGRGEEEDAEAAEARGDAGRGEFIARAVCTVGLEKVPARGSGEPGLRWVDDGEAGDPEPEKVLACCIPISGELEVGMEAETAIGC